MVSSSTNKVNSVDVVTITMKGRFDFTVHREFRSTYKNHEEMGMRFVVDMRQVDYIDSSALGMLLLLREHAQKYNGDVEITNCDPSIMNILKIANFDRLFAIS